MKISLTIITILLIFISLLLCTKNKLPFENQLIIDNNYIVNWPDTLKSSGIAYPDTSLPYPQQRAGALRGAKLDARNKLDNFIKLLPVSRINTLSQLCLSDTVLQNKITNYEISYFKVYDTRYMSDKSVEIDIFLLTEGLVKILHE
jgi:hypothetical protein